LLGREKPPPARPPPALTLLLTFVSLVGRAGGHGRGGEAEEGGGEHGGGFGDKHDSAWVGGGFCVWGGGAGGGWDGVSKGALNVDQGMQQEGRHTRRRLLVGAGFGQRDAGERQNTRGGATCVRAL